MHDNSNGAVTNTTIVIAILQCYKGILFDLYTHHDPCGPEKSDPKDPSHQDFVLLTLLNTGRHPQKYSCLGPCRNTLVILQSYKNITLIN